MNAKSDAWAIRLEIARGVLESVFDECDRYDQDETGGRVVGHVAVDNRKLVVRASGVIAPGPKARRSRTSFFQDGEYQEKAFRQIEARDPTIEHLGNWHTHHVNGYPTLSAGDVATYRRIVNHELHNLDFFYALLVTRRHDGRAGLDRYSVRHFVLFRGDEGVHEIRSADIRVIDEPIIGLEDDSASEDQSSSDGARWDGTRCAVAIRAHDQAVLGVLSPSLKPRLLARTETFFWKGPLSLIDGSVANVRIVEVEDRNGLVYYPRVSPASRHVAELCESPFKSASEAVRALELRMNWEIYESAKQRRGWKLWKR